MMLNWLVDGAPRNGAFVDNPIEVLGLSPIARRV